MKYLTLKNVFYFVPVALTLFTAILILSGQSRIVVKKDENLWIFISYVIIGLFYIVMYCLHVYKNHKIEKTEKRLWYVGLIFCAGIVSSVYYFIYIAKEDKLIAKKSQE